MDASPQDYLYDEWGEAITTRIIKEIDQTVIRIKSSPEQFPIFLKGKNIRRCVASPQTSIYFQVNKDHVEIYGIYDNRSNPKKLTL
jgi:hypothetical protein